jgi:hypothetical protein
VKIDLLWAETQSFGQGEDGVAPWRVAHALLDTKQVLLINPGQLA